MLETTAPLVLFPSLFDRLMHLSSPASMDLRQPQRVEVAEFTTDGEGRFKVSLAPGHYSVTKKDQQKGIGRYGPFDVDVAAGQMTKVEWHCDTGMR